MSWAGLASNELVTFTDANDGIATTVLLRKTSHANSSECMTKTDADTYLFIDTSYGPYAALASNEEITKADVQNQTCVNMDISFTFNGTVGITIDFNITGTTGASGTLYCTIYTDNGCVITGVIPVSSGATGLIYTWGFNTNVGGSNSEFSWTSGGGIINYAYVGSSTFAISDNTRCYGGNGNQCHNC